jgi:hypothetical protein
MINYDVSIRRETGNRRWLDVASLDAELQFQAETGENNPGTVETSVPRRHRTGACGWTANGAIQAVRLGTRSSLAVDRAGSDNELLPKVIVKAGPNSRRNRWESDIGPE